MSKITLTDENGTYSIEITEIETDLAMVCERLICPVLRAAGYHDDSIKSMFSDEVDV